MEPAAQAEALVLAMLLNSLKAHAVKKDYKCAIRRDSDEKKKQTNPELRSVCLKIYMDLREKREGMTARLLYEAFPG